MDIVGVLNEELSCTKTHNYWKYLKAKLKKENNQLVSATTPLKLIDSNKRLTDTLDRDRVIELAKHFPNNSAMMLLNQHYD